MSFIRSVVGLVMGCMLLASGAAHSLVGWPAQARELAVVHASPEQVARLAMGWQFSGLAMLVFGSIAVVTFVNRLRRRPVDLWPVWLVALGYVTYGAAALVLFGGDAFFLFTFLLPGVLLAAAAWPEGLGREEDSRTVGQ